ncbi:hypothetical protein PMAC_001803 [Pneumocystis sp. 'macacae']|nr:hypothetical protein PMAC_001803 [Pneumocystis sp. 'macacae']
MKSWVTETNAHKISRKVSRISLVDLSAEDTSDNELQFESAYARMLFSKDINSIETTSAPENEHSVFKKLDEIVPVEKQKEFPRQILKQNINQFNSALQITNTEDTDQYHISDKKVHFISTKNSNYHWNIKHNEELQSIFHQSTDPSVFSNSTALITIQTKTNYQHNQEPLALQTPALKQGWGTNTSSSARWKRVGRTGLGPPKRAERLSSESVEGLENTMEIEHEDSKQHFSDTEKRNLLTFNNDKENVPKEYIITEKNQSDFFQAFSNSFSPTKNQEKLPEKFKKIQSILINPINSPQNVNSVTQNKIDDSTSLTCTIKPLIIENSREDAQINHSKNPLIKEDNACYLSSALKFEKKYSTNINNDIKPQVNISSNLKTDSSLSQKILTKSKSITFVNSRPYNRLDLIGRGGSSKVFRVMDQNNKMFALKKVHFDREDKHAVVNFKDEIELLKKLSGHERIIKLYDSEINDAKGYLTMILEIGEIDLSHLLVKQHQRPLDINFIRLYWDQMLQAVQAVHEQKIVHSDLKPANFLLVKGSLKLIDFGIAKAIGNDTTNIHRDSQIGTINYMSPEALSEVHSATSGDQKIMKLGRASDIWSLGCILYQMVYGKTPFAHLTMFQKIKAIPDPKHSIDFPIMAFPISHSGQNQYDGVKVDKNLVRVMKSCLERDPIKRKSIPELLQDRFLRPEKHFQRHGPTIRLTLEQMIQLVEQTAEIVKSGKYNIDQLRAATSDSFTKLLEIQDQENENTSDHI